MLERALVIDNLDLVGALALSSLAEVLWEMAAMIAEASPKAAAQLIQHLVMDKQEFHCNLFKLSLSTDTPPREWVKQGTGYVHVFVHGHERRLLMWDKVSREILLDVPVINGASPEDTYLMQEDTRVFWEQFPDCDYALSFQEGQKAQMFHKLLTRGRLSSAHRSR